ncbi:Uma2 family endonuclease [Streptomyces yaizuensis]|uniref:Uma2 family endonuclease n=1 Tax=Streptomyces yaizuensis TaxID=2989713 RepID=A0ABQ5P585_9ACTN|nr:Uma2 family endonuclease [Streptomyces sp. YSPA8]GLF97734.1 Uma2 family endonuclease [Streptomyces sp. YSPA8]
MNRLSADYSHRDSDWDRLVEIFEKTDAPEGCKTEIVEGIVTVAPLPSNAHNFIADCVQRPLYSVIPDDWGICQRLGVVVPSRDSLFVPDLVVIGIEVLRAEGGYTVPAEAAALIVEITSPTNARQDRTRKADVYCHAGVPLYLLIDGWDPAGPTITLYGEPKNGVYRVLRAGRFGDPVRLPDPFGLELATDEFPGRA